MKVKVRTECPKCGKETFVEVYASDLVKFSNGMLAAQAFPYLEPQIREMLISGVCPTCWDEIFPVEDTEWEDLDQKIK